MRTKGVVDSDGRKYGYRINCPGCMAAGLSSAHVLHTGDGSGARWSFNGNVERPTFSPSLLVRTNQWEPAVTAENLEQWRALPWAQRKVNYVCHSFITDGRIQYLDDCTHPMKGMTVDLPEIGQ